MWSILFKYWWHKRKFKDRIINVFVRFKRVSFQDFKHNWDSIFNDFAMPYNADKLRDLLEKLVEEKVIRIDSLMSSGGEDFHDTEYVFLKTENVYNMQYYGKTL